MTPLNTVTSLDEATKADDRGAPPPGAGPTDTGATGSPGTRAAATSPAPAVAARPRNTSAPGGLSETLPEFLARGGDRTVWDVVIVGSGYGGSVAAHVLASAALRDDARVLLLERGREFRPGDFPSGFGDLPRELRVAHQTDGEIRGHEGLFDVRLGPDVVALVGNGLGGGSLINAGVMLVPEPDQVAPPADAAPHRHTLAAQLRLLQAHGLYRRATRLLGGEVQRHGQWVVNDQTRLPPAPGSTWGLRKAEALDRMARRDDRHRAQPVSGATPVGSASPAGHDCRRRAQPVPVTVAWDDVPGPGGAPREACNQCGDCLTGCNVGAKVSLDRSLLWQAKQRLGGRLTIVTGASVASLSQPRRRHEGPRPWLLDVHHTDARLQARETGNARQPSPIGAVVVAAQRVVLAAGTLGTPEILLRSRDHGMRFSGRLGQSFSANGDNIAAVHGLPGDTHAGSDERVPGDQRGVGPTITAGVAIDEPGVRPFQVQEFSVPGALKRVVDETVTTAAVLTRMPAGDWRRHDAADRDPMAVDPAAMRRTLVVGVIGHDDADGTLALAQPLAPADAAPAIGALRIDWPQARRGAQLEAAHDALRRLVAPGPGDPAQPLLVANPMWQLLPPGLEALVSQPRGPVLTVHPLGGCRIGADVAEGVVDELGRVFDADRPGPLAVHDALVVLDGSIVGASLGVNPALTIAALALHAMAVHVAAWELGTPDGDPWTEPGVSASPGWTQRAPESPCDPAPDDASALPGDTDVELAERQWGKLTLRDGAGRAHAMVLELTMGFRPQPLDASTAATRTAMTLRRAASRLRLYPAGEWDTRALRAADDAERAPFVCFEAALGGTLRFLHREASTPWQRVLRGGIAYARHRLLRDFWQRFVVARGQRDQTKPFDLQTEICDLVRLASHNGQRRRFDYALTIGRRLSRPGPWDAVLARGQPLHGHKRLGYAYGESPWTQLTHMTLTRAPGLAEGSAPVLALDARRLARQGWPLLRITRQRHHAEALAELLSLGLYLARVLIVTHLWSFRYPDRADDRTPERLPRAIAGLPDPEITTLVVDRRRGGAATAGRVDGDGDRDEPVTIRLTRYRRDDPARPSRRRAARGTGAAPPTPPRPLALLHGYSASGTTFTHASLGADAAAAFFAQQGRDVWVVDLRTSCGMPLAQVPWAMEQPALVDIPAALLHIRTVTGQKVDVLAHCIGGAMLGMAMLADASDVGAGRTELGTDTWLTAQQLGTLEAFHGNAADRDGGHATVGRIVLSQKGPVMRYTDANVLRAWVMQYARRWLLPERLSFRPQRDPGVAEQLLDRVLSSLPYPAADFAVENGFPPCRYAGWTGSRHRLDALFGRLFNAARLRPATLAAIDDLFGPINLDTVAQTIHFARHDAVTNQRGRGEFVTRRRLRERWAGVPTCVLHAADNALADPHTHRLLSEQLHAAGVPLHRVPLLESTGHQDTLIGTRSAAVFAEVEAFLAGHASLDTTAAPALPVKVCAAPWLGPRLRPLAGGGVSIAAMPRTDQGAATLWLVPVRHGIGSGAAVRFEPLPPATHPWAMSGEATASGRWHFAAPALAAPAAAAGGPAGWLAVFVYDTCETTARASLEPPASPAAAPGAGAAAATPGPQPPATATPPTAAAGPATRPTAAPSPPRAVLPGVSWLRLRPRRLPPALAAALPQPAPPASVLPTGAQPPSEVLEAVAAWLADDDGDDIARCHVRRDDLARAAVLLTATPATAAETAAAARGPAADGQTAPVAPVAAAPASVAAATGRAAAALPAPDAADAAAAADAAGGVAARGLRFALASCQYPDGLFDRLPAAAVLQRLALETVDLAVLAGDQIYADATAGLVDPSRRDERYEQPHERAWRQAGMRAVMRRTPLFTLPDDHELVDNWEPLPAALGWPAGGPGTKEDPDDARRRARVRRQHEAAVRARRDGLAAFLRYQRFAGPEEAARKARDPDRSADTTFVAGGHPFYLLDTRTGRRRGAPSAGSADGRIVGDDRLDALIDWLRRHRDAVKFVVTPSMLLPRQRDVARRPGNACRGDAWDGFPQSLGKLLQAIGDDREPIRHTVFLSGDAHHSLFCEAWVGAKRIKLVSVHSSALYAPYPFANGSPSELAADTADDGRDLHVPLHLRTTHAGRGDGFAVLEVGPRAGGGVPSLRVAFVKAGDDAAGGRAGPTAFDIPLA